jgi:preprotein translocase subunit SecD
VTEVNGVIVNNVNDFENAVKNLKAGEFISLLSNGNVVTCNAVADGDIGFNIRSTSSTNLKFGIEIEGGTRVILQPSTPVTPAQMNDVVRILTERINLFGLKDIRVTPIGTDLIQLEASGLSGNDIQNFLAKQGKFEGKLAEPLDFTNGTSNIIIGGVIYAVVLIHQRLSINNSQYSDNETFSLNGIDFEVRNITNNSAVVLADLFSGSDIVNVFTDAQHSGISSISGGYKFTFTIQTTKDSADRFAKATQGQQTYIQSGETYIVPKLVLFLDNQPVSTLNIIATLAGQSLTTPTIEGFGQTIEDAQNEMLRLQTILRSGSLPVKLTIERVDTITQSEGSRLINSTIIVALVAAVVVAAIIFVRYRDFKLSVPMLLLSFSEILLILGFAASQIVGAIIVIGALFVGIYSKNIHGLVGWVSVILMALIAAIVVVNSWTLDIPAIAGLIAVLGTSVNQMIIITDQLLMERDKDLATRHRTALEIVTNSASMVTFAMIPLVFIGIGVLKGFAITTVVGVLVGFLLTRPAYMFLLERMKKLHV